MKLFFDETSEVPKYQQIVQQISGMIENGELTAKEKLPPERNMGAENSIARGTVQMAYQELIRRGIAYAVQGSGTYISGKCTAPREDIIIEKVEQLFEDAAHMDMPAIEVVEIFRKQMVRHIVGDVKLMTAWVDCCPEALQLAKNEFKNVENNKIQQFLLENVLKDPELLSEEFELIVTTTHHYETLIQAFPLLINKIEVVTIMTNRETLIELAKVAPEKRVVLWSISKRFMENIMFQIKDFNNINVVKTFISDWERDEIREYLKTTDILVTSKEYRNLGELVMLNLIDEYKAGGGRVLEFEYSLDPGSIMYLQTRICGMIAKKEKNIFRQ